MKALPDTSSSIPNSIGYVEYAYVVQNGMTYALLQNAAGNFVGSERRQLLRRSRKRGLEERTGLQSRDDQCAGPNAYPITATTFILMPKQPKDKAKSDAAIGFFKYALEHGQPQAKKLDYVPLPDDAGPADRKLHRRQHQVSATACRAIRR